MLIVIAKHNLIGNCLLDSLKGKSESDGDNCIKDREGSFENYDGKLNKNPVCIEIFQSSMWIFCSKLGNNPDAITFTKFLLDAGENNINLEIILKNNTLRIPDNLLIPSNMPNTPENMLGKI